MDMDKIYREQSALGDELVKINAKLQVGDVQAVQLEALAKTAEEKWKKFKKNHEIVETHGKATDEYIAKDYFNYIQGIIISIRQQTKKEDAGNEFKIMENVEPIKEPLTFQNLSCYQKMDKLIAEIQRWLDVLLKELNEGNFSCARLSELELTDSYNRLKQLVQNSDDELCEARFVEVQKNYYQAVKKVKMQLDEQDRAPLRPSIKLEEVKIPVFNGDIKKWSAFHDLFHNLVHTSLGMAKVEKMYRLKGLLIGEPANIIQHLPATDANYEAAWSIITQRYNNTRRLFESQVDRLLDQPVVNSEIASSIKQLLDTSNECIHALQALNLNLKDAEPFIARIILRKLDREGIRRYEQATNKTREIQSLKDVLNYLDQQFHSLEATSKPSFNIKKHYNFNTKKDNMFLTAATSVVRCSFCNIQGHSNDECRKFTKLTTKQRWQSVRDKKLCYMCLNHSYVEPCQNKVGRCPKCSSRHHLLLHEDIHIKKNEEKATTSTPVTKNSNTAGEKKSVMVARQKSNPGVLLATARIRVRSANGEDLLLRALIDQGSQISAITEGAAQQLQLPRNRCKAELRGLGDVFVGAVKSKINLEVRPRFSSDAVFMAEALVLPKVANNNPAISFNYDIGEFSNYILADPCFNKADRIDVLIGADMYAAIGEGVSTKFGSILGQSTKIGLLLSGKIESVSSTKSMTVAITTELEKFWELEEIPSEHQTSSVDQCDSYFQETVSRDINTGKIVVKLPFTQEKQLGELRKIAVARQLQLERRLEANPDLKTSYIQFMDEYLAMGHMKLVEGTGEGRYYIPHQPVVKADSLTTRLRVVFDASAKSSNGSSLNDILMVGPRLQKDLFDIVVKWRLWQYVLTADVEKMYRQIMVAEEDQEYQHIVWRPRKTESLRDYKLTTVTYGTASAPFLATKALQWIGDNCGEHDKIISCIIKNDFYMDDLMTGADTKDECCYIQKKITNQLEDYGLHLRKWLSNNGDIMKQIPNFAENEVIEIADNETVKMLGLQWNPMEDIFTYRINADSNVTVTKRYALSRLARIYDPIGWLSPITIVAKLFIQQLWLLKMDWDQRLSDKLAKEWQDFIKQLENLKAVKVSRWLWTRKEEVAEIHGFADASEKAYAAVVYLKINDKITIIAAKSKVNPVKNKKTLPKLELCAAHLLAKLLSKIMSIAQRPWKVLAWSDSTIVLAWIENNSCKQKFVKVRVAEINKLTNSADWRHVRSKDNPADMASRGIQVVKFVDNQLWWNGPTWLKLNEDHWPKESVDNVISTVHLSSTAENNFIEKVIERCSSYNKVKRVIAYVIRFIGKLKKQPCEKYLTAKELNAEKAIVRKWPLGNHPGSDGRIRVVSVKTQKGAIKRPVVKICPLQIEEGEPANLTQSTRPIQVNHVHMENKVHREKKSSPFQNIYVVMLFILLFFGLKRVNASEIDKTEIIELKAGTALYLDELGSIDIVSSKWKLIIYYDLNAYYEEMDGIRKYISQLRSKCKLLTHFEEPCVITTDALGKRFEILQNNNELFLKPSRNRRAPFEFVGTIYHMLFGIMDAEDRQIMEENMRNLLENQKDLKNVYQKQTSVIDSTINILKKTTAEVNKHFEDLNKQLNKFHYELVINQHVERMAIMFQMMSSQVEKTLDHCELIQSSIIDLLIDLHHGRLNPKLLKPTQLEAETVKIKDKLPKNLNIPGVHSGSETKEIYNLMKAEAVMLNSTLVIQAQIPLINGDTSNIFKIIPLPVTIKNETVMVELRSEFIVYNFNLDSYILLTQADLNTCGKRLNNHYICQGNWHWRAEYENHCEITPLKQNKAISCNFLQTWDQELWSPLTETNTWLFKVPNNSTLEIDCKSQPRKWQSIPGQGILKLKEGCTARYKGLSITSSQNIQSDTTRKFTKMLWAKDVIKIEEKLIKPFDSTIINNTLDISYLKERLELLKKENVELRSLNFHHINSHLSLALVIILMLGIISFFLKEKCKNRQRVKIDFNIPNSVGRQNV